MRETMKVVGDSKFYWATGIVRFPEFLDRTVRVAIPHVIGKEPGQRRNLPEWLVEPSIADPDRAWVPSPSG